MNGTQFFTFLNHRIHSPTQRPLGTVVTGLLIFHCSPVMATFIAYQPRKNAPSFRSPTFSKSPTLDLPSWVPSRQGSKSPQRVTPVSNADFVDLTVSDQNTARGCPVAREFLEPTGHNPDDRDIRVAGAGARSNVTDGDMIEDGKECDKDDRGIDSGSDTSELPSLADIFALGDTGFEGSPDLSCEALTTPAAVDRAGKECCYVGGCEDGVNPTATAAAGVQLGAWRTEAAAFSEFSLTILRPSSKLWPTVQAHARLLGIIVWNGESTSVLVRAKLCLANPTSSPS
jgi:hypothetical protein